MGFVNKIVDQVSNVVEHVLDDPLQAIVTVGAMAMGVPPVWAGALGGAAGAAEHGGNILEGAALGGITGYVGGAAGGLAAEAGAGQILSSAAGGAASGATGAALTGGDIVSGALTGGAMGGASGFAQDYFNPATGNTTYTYDDGSTITTTPAGDVVGSTVATDGTLAPVVDLSPGSQPVTNADGSVTTPDGSTTYTYDDGSTMTTRADGTNTSTPSTNGSVFDTTTTTPDTTQNDDGSVTNPDGSTTYTFDDGSTMTLNLDGTSSSTIATDSGVLTPGVLPGGTTTPSGWTPTPITPIFPIVVPGTKTPKDPNTPVVPSTEVASGNTLPTLHVPTGLNPGYMAPTPFYQTTSPVQSQYYWGGHDYQAGPTFDAAAYNTVAAAPKTPWGLQQMGDVARPQDIVNYINSPEYQAQFVSAPAVPGGAH